MDQGRRVVVTGMGAISPFGRGVELFWTSLLAGRSAVRPVEGFDASLYRGKIAAEVPREAYADPALRERLGNPQERATLFAAIAVEEALADAGLPPVFASSERAGCAIGTLCSSGGNLREYGRAFLFEGGAIPEQGGAPQATVVAYQLDHLTAQFNMTGPSTLISTACASSTDALGFAFDAIRNGDCDIMLAGGGDVVDEIVHGGFNAVYSISTSIPRPFDQRRDGFAIGEGGAMMVLESLDSARRRGATIYAEILGYGLSNSAFHMTSTSKDGAGEGLAVRRALQDAGVASAQIDYVNAHGTATGPNDATETRFLSELAQEGGGKLMVSSIKPMIGHCMGAAGIFEAIATVLTVRHDRIPPTINTEGDEPGIGFRLIKNQMAEAPVEYAISESFGFAGACSCVVVGKFRNEQQV